MLCYALCSALTCFSLLCSALALLGLLLAEQSTALLWLLCSALLSALLSSPLCSALLCY